MSILDGLGADIAGALDDVFFDAVLTRAGATTGPAYDPTPGTPTTYTCKAIRDSYGVGHLSGGLVDSSDVKIIILQASLPTTPKSGDTITITGMGGPWTIVAGGSGQPAVSADGVNATWECRAS